jgi:hypothetical protein
VGTTAQKNKIGELRLKSISALSTRQERGEYKFILCFLNTSPFFASEIGAAKTDSPKARDNSVQTG